MSLAFARETKVVPRVSKETRPCITTMLLYVDEFLFL